MDESTLVVICVLAEPFQRPGAETLSPIEYPKSATTHSKISLQLDGVKPRPCAIDNNSPLAGAYGALADVLIDDGEFPHVLSPSRTLVLLAVPLPSAPLGIAAVVVPLTEAALPLVFWFRVGNVQLARLPLAGVPSAGAVSVLFVSVATAVLSAVIAVAATPASSLASDT